MEILSLKGGCTGSSESTFMKMPHCWKWHVAAHILLVMALISLVYYNWSSYHNLVVTLVFRASSWDFGTYHISNYTPDRRQSKTLSAVDKRGSKIDRNSVFDCHLSPAGRQMAIQNTVCIDFLIDVPQYFWLFDCRLPGVFDLILYVPSTVFQSIRNCS